MHASFKGVGMYFLGCAPLGTITHFCTPGILPDRCNALKQTYIWSAHKYLIILYHFVKYTRDTCHTCCRCLYICLHQLICSEESEQKLPCSPQLIRQPTDSAGELARVTTEVERLISLITASAVSKESISSAVDSLRQDVQAQGSAEVKQHLECMSNTLKMMTHRFAMAADVHNAYMQLQGAMLKVVDGAADAVRDVFYEVQRRLKSNSMAVGYAVNGLQSSLQKVQGDVTRLSQAMEHLRQEVATKVDLTRHFTQLTVTEGTDAIHKAESTTS